MFGGGFNPRPGAEYPPPNQNSQQLPYGLHPGGAPYPDSEQGCPYPTANQAPANPLYPSVPTATPTATDPYGMPPQGQQGFLPTPGQAGPFPAGGFSQANPGQVFPPAGAGAGGSYDGNVPQPNMFEGTQYHGTPGSNSRKVSIRMQCSDLVSKDFFSKSDPLCVVYTRQGGVWVEHGRTEVVQNNHFPIWTKRFAMDYVPTSRQEIKFEVYDADDAKAKRLKDQDFLGRATTTLDEMVVNHGRRFQAPLRDGPPKQKNAVIAVNVEMISTVTVQLVGQNLKDLDTFSKSDPFFRIQKKTPYGQLDTVYTSEKLENDLNPVWRAFSILDDKLCNGDHNLPLRIAVYDWDSGNNHDLIGYCDTSLSAMENSFERGRQLELVNPRKRNSQMGLISIRALHIN